MALDDEDRMSKIRPLISHMNEKFQELAKPLAQKLSVDEAMEHYNGHHPSKQFLRVKPVRFGYKIRCLTSSTGNLVKYSPYTGKDGRQAGRGLGESVVKNLVADTIVKNESHLH